MRYFPVASMSLDMGVPRVMSFKSKSPITKKLDRINVKDCTCIAKNSTFKVSVVYCIFHFPRSYKFIRNFNVFTLLS